MRWFQGAAGGYAGAMVACGEARPVLKKFTYWARASGRR
ncbi:Hypothetical protein A7982_06860 [Minicystis rosea]|nr:Hypothetical protein A7982_06860 [Minicystis rosea]